MKNLIDYAYQDNGTDFRKELYSAIHDKVAAHIEAKKQEIAAGFMGQQEESYEDEGESLDEAISIPVFPDTHKKAKSNGVDTVHTTKTPVGERPKGIGWSLHRSGQQHNEPHDVWKSTSRKVAKHTGLGESLDEALHGKNVGDADSHLHHSRNIIDMSKSHVTREIRKASDLSNELHPNKDASDDTIYKGLKHPDELTGVRALLHPNAKDHHVIKALKHRHSEVRAVAVGHPLAPRDIVDHMARNDVDHSVRSEAKRALSERDR